MPVLQISQRIWARATASRATKIERMIMHKTSTTWTADTIREIRFPLSSATLHVGARAIATRTTSRMEA
jgi:hypothetical protein